MVNKKGFFKALMTVALAMMSVSIFATAPVITDPGDYIVGDAEQGIGNNVFVFPDAIDLDGSVVDDNLPDASIKWSFDDPTARYRLNGVMGGVADPNTVGAANDLRIADTDTGDAPNDASPNTLTIRNENLSPVAGSPPYGDPAGVGVLPGETSTVTLYASDGSLFDSVSVVLYTADDDSDSLSGGILTNLFDHDYENDPSLRTGWLGQVTPSSTAGTTGTGTGFCMYVPAVNIANATVRWLSPHNSSDSAAPGFVQLVDLAAYRFRTTMYSDVTANNATPYWTVGYNNTYIPNPPQPPGGIYGGDTWVLDVAGGANAIGKTVASVLVGRYDYDFWGVPPSAKTLAWRGLLPDVGAGPPAENAFSPFNATYDARNDMNFTIRILDFDATLNVQSRVGTICLKRLRCDRVSLNDLTTTLMYGPPINTTTNAVIPDSTGGSPGDGTAVIRNASADILFNMGAAFQTNANGGRKRPIFYDQLGTSTIKKNYPVALDGSWVTDEVLMMKGAIRSDVGGGAGTGTVEGTDPVEIIFLDWQTNTVEVGGYHYVQKGAINNMKRAGSPRLLFTTAGAPQEYITLMASNNTSRSTSPTFEGLQDAIRPSFDFQNSTTNAGLTDGRNPFVLSTMQLLRVDTSGL
jgi:hypothetical protein